MPGVRGRPGDRRDPATASELAAIAAICIGLGLAFTWVAERVWHLPDPALPLIAICLAGGGLAVAAEGDLRGPLGVLLGIGIAAEWVRRGSRQRRG